VARTKSLLENLGGCAVQGYRAPSYSIGAGNLWALRLLEETGHRYSASIYPIRHDLYGMPDAPRFAFTPEGCSELTKVPVTTILLAGSKCPCGGGGYFRLYPYAYSRWALRRVLEENDRFELVKTIPVDTGSPSTREPLEGVSLLIYEVHDRGVSKDGILELRLPVVGQTPRVPLRGLERGSPELVSSDQASPDTHMLEQSSPDALSTTEGDPPRMSFNISRQVQP
jgi:hypothetical protein